MYILIYISLSIYMCVYVHPRKIHPLIKSNPDQTTRNRICCSPELASALEATSKTYFATYYVIKLSDSDVTYDISSILLIIRLISYI